MRLRLLNAFLAASLALAAVLSAAPQVHDWLHDIGDHSNHECAATLMSSGGLEHSPSPATSAVPEPAPVTVVFRSQAFPGVLAFLAFTRLEHAPPLFS